MSWRRIALAGIAVFAPDGAHAQPGSPAGPVPVERLAARRQVLAARMGNGVAILIAAPEGDLDGRDHLQATFSRQDNDVFYLAGIESPGAWLALVARDSVLTESIIFLPPLDTLYERWWVRRLGPTSEATTITGIKDVRSAALAETDLRRVMAQTARGGRTPTLFAKRGSAERANKFFAGIEDVVLVTPNGHDVLSSRLPREPSAVEAFFAKRRPASSVR